MFCRLLFFFWVAKYLCTCPLEIREKTGRQQHGIGLAIVANIGNHYGYCWGFYKISNANIGFGKGSFLGRYMGVSNLREKFADFVTEIKSHTIKYISHQHTINAITFCQPPPQAT